MKKNPVVINEVSLNGKTCLVVAAAGITNQPCDTVIFYHGWGGQKERVISEVFPMAQSGLRVIIPDALHHGLNHQPKDYEFWQIVLDAIKQFKPLLQAMEKKGWLDGKKIGVAGLSMGGIITCGLLCTYPQIAAAECLMGSPEYHRFAKYLVKSLPKDKLPDPKLIDQQLALLDNFDLSKQPAKINQRYVHFWHGDCDKVVPQAFSWEFYQSIKDQPFAKNVTYSTTHGGTHRVPTVVCYQMAQHFNHAFGAE